MRLMESNRSALLLVATFSIFAITPLLKPEFFVSNDMLGPVYRLVELDVSIKDGDLFPRWSPDLYGGLGGPLFNFYAPFSYYVAEFFHLSGLGYVKSIKAAYVISFILSGIFMYAFAADKMNRNGAFAAAILYMYAPYRFEDVYARGAFSESFTFVFLPLILLSFHRIAEQKDGRYLAIGALSLAGLILCHNAIALFFTGFLVVYLLFLLSKFPSSKAEVTAAIALALSISSFFWLPAIIEKNQVTIENILIYDYHDYFIKSSQIVPSLSDILTKSNNVNHLAVQIGIVHLILTILAIIYVRSNYVIFFSFLLLGVLFFMSSLSSMLWENIPLVQYVQFPNRLFTIVALLTSLLGGFFVSHILKNEGRKESINVVILSLLIAFSSFNHIGSEEHVIYNDGDFTSEKIREFNAGLTYDLDYFPRGAVRFSNIEIKDKVEVVRGNAQVSIMAEKSTFIGFETDGDASLLRINIYYFPGWTAYVDGKRTVLKTDESGLIALDIPEGRHKILLKFEDTPVRKFSTILSIFAFMVLALQTGRAYRAASKSPGG